RELLLLTTAGAVEHHARKVEVLRCDGADDDDGNGDDEATSRPYPAEVAAVCLDLDVALLRVPSPDFWGQQSRHRRRAAARRHGGGSRGSSRGSNSRSRINSRPGLVPLQLEGRLPQLHSPIIVAGFPLGGGSLCVTSGVVSRLEVVEYSHSGRGMLALQVDAPLNNGGWGGPALSRSTGRVVGLAFQKSGSQTWMERYDDVAAEMMYGDEGSDEDGDGSGGADVGGGPSGGSEGNGDGEDYYGGDEADDAENIGYLVPSQLLQLVLGDYARARGAALSCRQQQQQQESRCGEAASRLTSSSAPMYSSQTAGAGNSSSSSRSKSTGTSTLPSTTTTTTRTTLSTSSSSSSTGPLYLDGRPRLGLRYQRLESRALRRFLGMTGAHCGAMVGAAEQQQQQQQLEEQERGPAPAAAAGGMQPRQRHSEPEEGTGGNTGNAGGGGCVMKGRVGELSGVLVTGVDPTGSAAGVVQVHDVLLELAGRQVSYDGSTLLRPGGRQRVLFGHWAAVGRVGEHLPIAVLRNGVRLELSVRLRDAGAPFLPVSLGPGRRPQFLLVGPLVFTAFSLPYWYQLMSSQQQQGQAHRRSRGARREQQRGLLSLLAPLEWGMPALDDGEEVVVLSEVLECGDSAEAASIAEQYDNASAAAAAALTGNITDTATAAAGPGAGPGAVLPSVGAEAAAWSRELGGSLPRRLAELNGQRVRNLEQLAAVVVAATARRGPADMGTGGGQFLRLVLEPSGAAAAGAAEGPMTAAAAAGARNSSSNSNSSSSGSSSVGHVLVLDAGSLAAHTRAVLRHHSMGGAMTDDMRRRLATNWPFEGQPQPQGSSRQRRQQGRRFAVSGRR
ncbi:hypothetical protein Agub_g12067, partial [Astrephomene gubernaculifera]